MPPKALSIESIYFTTNPNNLARNHQEFCADPRTVLLFYCLRLKQLNRFPADGIHSFQKIYPFGTEFAPDCSRSLSVQFAFAPLLSNPLCSFSPFLYL
jgi:hypothetical protein